ncbi:glycosyltransferase family 2 protein [Siccirubricoccus sp. G192]|uniref:glycosyltransferase n=1 Tax=Siccirubricoccus sp. G192 TaxID=2849651 RepID=UPI001C2BB288|nr:glycosyltransferase family 2 protein [Siccirubricoccus sp. G192]MBV1799849.1 glycosyltransferase family 2 protein [Siccirubricoccus sp. G192]
MGLAAGAVLLGWMVLALLATLAPALYLRLLRRPQPQPAAWPPILVLVPVRGAAPLLPEFLAALAAQDHPAWRVAFAVESAADPAFAPLARFAAARPGQASVVLAGAAARRGQKVHNLLAALAALRPEDAALVTLDADMVPPPGLLTQLVRPLLTGQGDIATGYRWTLPGGPGIAAALLALIDMGIATLPRCARCNLCWGGATAISRAALARLDLPRLWDRAISDDLALSLGARAAGLRIYAPLTVRPPGPVAPGLRAALGFGRRQYRLVRLHAPGVWALAGLFLVLPAAGGAVALAAVATGSGAALAWLGAALLLQRLRAGLRAAIAREVLPPGAAALAARTLRRGLWLGPAAHGLHLLAWLASSFGAELAWAGRRYRLAANGSVRAVLRQG